MLSQKERKARKEVIEFFDEIVDLNKKYPDDFCY